MSKLRFDVVSLFPEAFKNFFNHGLIKKAFKEKIASYLIVSSITGTINFNKKSLVTHAIAVIVKIRATNFSS